MAKKCANALCQNYLETGAAKQQRYCSQDCVRFTSAYSIFAANNGLPTLEQLADILAGDITILEHLDSNDQTMPTTLEQNLDALSNILD